MIHAADCKRIIYCSFLLILFAFSCFNEVHSLSAAEQADRIAAERFQDLDLFILPSNPAASLGWQGKWKTSQILPPQIVESTFNMPETPRQDVLIMGTGDRNNPLRRQLAETFTGDELFVGYRFLYEPDEIDAGKIDPEFFILWLDRNEGSDRAVHNSQVPNIGVHLADRGPSRGKNVFMVRFGSQQTAWSHRELEPGKTYHVIARLSKEQSGERNDFSQLQLWVNPNAEDTDQPLLTLSKQQGINQIRWAGFGTGVKTEIEDRIRIGDLILSRSWEDVYNFLESDSNHSPGKSSQQMPQQLVWKEPIHFRDDIYPILKERCFDCHAGEFPDSGYRLDVRNEFLGYSTGEAFVLPGNSRRSHLIDVLTSKADDGRMPPDEEPLSEIQIAKFRAWIDQGLTWDDKLLPAPQVESDHWAFQKISRPEVPRSIPTTQQAHPIDAFIATRQHELGIQATEPASRRILIRRLYLDLLGLPPTIEETKNFINNNSSDAYEDLVEQVLNSPHYGERMGRFWLDLARWGESQGFQHDIPRPFAWRYRDYVINSFNNDKPYDQFLKEQLAGDELENQSDETLVATGFLAAARISGNQMDKEIQRTEVMFDIVDNTASSLLGLTLECAQCHNHKFEPLSQRDYYRFLAFFSKGQMGNLKLQQAEQIPAEEIKNWFSKSSYNFYMSEAKKLKINPADYEPHTWGYYSPVTGNSDIEFLPVVNRSPLPYSPEYLKRQQASILVRGVPGSPGLPVEPGWPAVLGTVPSELSPTPRQALSDWLSSPENPLVARVWANRIWQSHFGRGIVSTPSNFGTHGSLPSHPQLLDWLASELMSNGWSTKHLHRLIVTSKTYKQSSRLIPQSLEQDPENKSLWRWPQRRLEAEAIRDSVLVATGELNRIIGGPSIPPQHVEEQLRRTIYLTQRRSELPDVMTMFDAPDGIKSCSRRDVSTVALQPLYLLNSPFVVSRAKKLAELVQAGAAQNRSDQVNDVFIRTLGREPTEVEKRQAVSLFSDTSTPVDISEEKSADMQLIQFCHAMLNLNEFVYLP